jgi:DNA polymerase III alpha subunit (gram-positive type)
MLLDSYVAFDCETTGFSTHARVLELGIVYFENGLPVDRWSSFFNPPDLDWLHPSVLEALAVNKITKEMCAGAPEFKDVIGEIMSRLEDDVWVGHNLAFDKKMLTQEFERAGFPFDHKPALEICTMCTSYKLDPIGNRHGIEPTAARWGVEPENVHRAEVDALTSGQILQRMIESGRLPIQEPDVVSFQKEAAASWLRRPRR